MEFFCRYKLPSSKSDPHAKVSANHSCWSKAELRAGVSDDISWPAHKPLLYHYQNNSVINISLFKNYMYMYAGLSTCKQVPLVVRGIDWSLSYMRFWATCCGCWESTQVFWKSKLHSSPLGHISNLKLAFLRLGEAWWEVVRLWVLQMPNISHHRELQWSPDVTSKTPRQGLVLENLLIYPFWEKVLSVLHVDRAGAEPILCLIIPGQHFFSSFFTVLSLSLHGG